MGLTVVLIYGALWPFAGPDFDHFLYPWLDHIRTFGPVRAFAAPFSNYTPPYLYLLSAGSLLGLSNLATIKLLSVLGTLFLASAMWRLVRAIRPEKASEAAAIMLILPTVIINGPMLGQCDALWVGCCLLAVVAALEKRTYMLAVWAGLAFSIKAQSIFLAPFALLVVARDRRWEALLIPPAVYLLTVVPAWLEGWPLYNLLLIYVRQYGALGWITRAPNLWAVPQLISDNPPPAVFLLALIMTVLAVLAYLTWVRGGLLSAALLSAMIVPWFMPKMHERYFLLADCLSFALLYADRRAAPIFVATQTASLLSLVSYATALRYLNALGSLFMLGAITLLIRRIRTSQDERAAQKLLPMPKATAEPQSE